MNALFFQLFIRTFSGKTVSIQVQPSDTVAAVKDKVQNKQGEVVGDQYLAYGGKQLDDRRSLGDYGVGQGCTLELSSRLRGGCYWCHKLGHNPSANPHCSENCRDRANSYIKLHQPHADGGGQPHTAGSIGGTKPRCQYGTACYRKCPTHKANFDHSSPPQSAGVGQPHAAGGGGGTKPRCQYGTACYRKCPTHKANFDHSSPPQHGSVVKKPKCKYGSACYRACPQHKAKYDHSSPIQTHGKEWRMFHGTSLSAAQQIQQGGKHGLRPSTSGMLGAGVYCSRDITKARNYAHHPGGGVVFELRVRTGRVKAIRHVPHPLQTTWHQAGYDSAWVPKGVNPNGHEENCVWDHTKVTIVGVAWSDCGFTW
jgi:large subunit ribosomal protein L40e